MSIKSLFSIVFGGIILVSLLIMAATYVMLRNQHDLESSFNNRYQAYVRADELRQSSDDLMRMART